MLNNDINNGASNIVKKISKLPDEVVAKIAAGEVVINPASVVKELVENSLDAHANYIEIHIKNGGKSYIKVADNGIGMLKDDLLLSVERYTTSKISKLEDVYNIQSYGFRGEALASIAEVSRMIITTFQGKAFQSDNFISGYGSTEKMVQNIPQVAHRLEVIGGKIVKVSDTYREPGTTVEVYDLFFNIPARRKFLSSDKIETRMVTEVIEKFILSRPDVHFILKADEELIYNAKPGSLEDRFTIIFPEVKEFKKIENSENSESNEGSIHSEYFKVSGIISSPQHTRKNRTGQIFFVNKRFVTDPLLNLSLERGYGESLVQGEHPYAVIFLEFQPDKIDVNIHPQKLQVKFSNPQYVYNNLAKIIRENVRKFSEYSLYIQRPSVPSALSTPNESDENKQNSGSFNNLSNLTILRKSDKTHNFDYQRDFHSTNQMDNTNGISKELNSALLFQSLKSINIKDFLILKNRYIVFEDVDGVVIMDFHAAHERIIYERLKDKTYESVSLLIPIRIKLSKSLIQISEQLFEEFKELGFFYIVNQFEDGSGEVEIRQIPSILKVTEAADVFLESLEEYKIPFEKPETLKHVLATKACKAAVKTNDRLSDDEVKQLIGEIKDKQLLTCPHGRPILMKLSFTQIDSYFERI